MMERTQRNPFICGGPVPQTYFTGREREVRMIFDRIASPARGCVAISGGPRMGKTSLLQYICNPNVIQSWGLSLDEYFFVYFDCPSIGSFTPSRFWQRILTLLSRPARENSLTSLVEAIESALAKETIDASDFEPVLDEIWRAGRVLVLLLDEFEWCIDPRDEHTTRAMLSGLRALINRRPRVLSLVVVTRSDLREVCRPIKFLGSPFYNNFSFRRLTPLKEINQLFEKTLEGTGIEFGPEEYECIRELGGTHPYLIQLAGALIFDARAQGLKVADCLELIRSEFEERSRYHFAGVWEDSNPQERMLLILFALCGLARRAEEQAYDLKTLQHILSRGERALTSLAERGLITEARPMATLSPPVFGSWVLREIRSCDEREFAEYASLMFDLLPKREAEYAVEAMQLASGRKSAGPEFAREKIGRYEIVEEIGRGAMGVVYKAFDPNIDRWVALKVMHFGPDTQSEELKRRFKREAISAGRLKHPNIVAVHDADEDRGEPFMVVEYLEGPTLAQVIETESPLTLERVIGIVGQIGTALDYAHQHGVVHMDIKPLNIFLLENEQVKVADFGLARLISASDLTQNGEIHGTFGYTSPEQILGHEIDGRSDIFSLGIVTYEMLTGRKPFEEENVHFIISRTLDEQPLAFEALDSELLPDVKEVLLKATAKDVNERYQTCAELRDSLKSIAQKLGKTRRSSIFISYSSADRDFVEKLASDLRASGIEVWLDKWEIKVGDSIIQKINDGIRDNDYLAIVLSPASVRSRWVRKELSAALMKELEESRSVVVLPILCKGCDIPPLLAGKRYADFREDYERGLKEVQLTLESAISERLLPPIYRLANLIRDRHEADDQPYTLLLGSSLSLTSEVRRAVCGSGDWETFWMAVEKMSPLERRAAFKRPLDRLLSVEGYRALTNLLAAGYFEVVFTLNVDDTLDNELGVLRADEYGIWVYGDVTSAEMVANLKYGIARPKVLKLRGDINAHKLPLTPQGQFEFPPLLEEVVVQLLSQDTILVGDIPYDTDIQRCIRQGDGSLWVVVPEEPRPGSFLRRIKQARPNGEVVTGPEAEFGPFFQALAEALEVYETMPPTRPPARRYFLNISHSAKAGALVGDMVRLSLSLTPEYPGPDSVPIEARQREVSFFVQAEGFYIQEGEDVITFSLPAGGTEGVEATVELQARLPGAHQITIEPFYDGQRHWPLSVPASVRFDEDVKKRPELPSPLAPRPVPQPDLCLRVYTIPLNPEASRLRLEYVLYSPLRQLHLPGVPVGSVEVSALELTRLHAQLDRLLRRAFPIGSEELYDGLRSVGRELYTMLFSSGLKQIYCDVWDKAASWLVLCDADPWIPWELVKPHGAGWEHDFLAACYSLGRWVEGWGVSRPAEFPLGAAYFAPDAGLAGHHAMEEWTQLVANGDVPRMEESLLTDWPGGYSSALSFSSPVWGLHFESYPERLSPTLRGLVAQDTERFSSEEVVERRLDLRQKRPVVTFGMLALERQTALTEVEARWMPTFIQSGASAFIGPLWATAPQADRIFWRAFYQALWERVPLGEAMLTARQSLRQALPDSLDWLAYFMVGDPMARSYIPRPGDGYVALECRNHDLTQPMQMDKTYSFVASLRATPPPWYTGRLYQTQEEAWDDPQVFVFAPGFQVPQALLPVDMRLSEMGSVQFDLVPKIAGEHDIFVKFLAGEEVRQSLTLHVDVESRREGQG
jgi:serine/threonine protein kinase